MVATQPRVQPLVAAIISKVSFCDPFSRVPPSICFLRVYAIKSDAIINNSLTTIRIAYHHEKGNRCFLGCPQHTAVDSRLYSTGRRSEEESIRRKQSRAVLCCAVLCAYASIPRTTAKTYVDAELNHKHLNENRFAQSYDGLSHKHQTQANCLCSFYMLFVPGIVPPYAPHC